MIGTIVNTLALLVGTSIGCLVKKGINKRYEDVLFIAIGASRSRYWLGKRDQHHA
ncbi:hypothetical protein IMAU50151_01609 [Lactobacillus helveticus]|nr:hypothetical protein [Lactobacillus helveticus]